MAFFLERREILDLVCHLASLDNPVGRLDETVDIDPGVGRKRCDQADIRAFRRLDRADTAIVRRMYVTDFETGTLTGQATGSEGREPTFVGDFGKRVGLVHELGKLA